MAQNKNEYWKQRYNIYDINEIIARKNKIKLDVKRDLSHLVNNQLTNRDNADLQVRRLK
ncbi:MAG TPA: hypothetical protein VK106_00430 [Balneolaceae bacterium]|nr:hypothetical protein [Balneolaceae bacterium]